MNFADGPVHVDVDPVMFQLGSLQVGWPGFATALGLALLLGLTWLIWSSRGGTLADLEPMALAGLAAGVLLGGLIALIVTVADPLAGRVEASLNGVLFFPAAAAAAVAIAWTRRGHGDAWRLADTVALAAPPALAVMDGGCVVAGCLLGRPGDFPVGFIYERGDVLAPPGVTLLGLPLLQAGFILLVLAVLALVAAAGARPGTVALLLVGAQSAGIGLTEVLAVNARWPLSPMIAGLALIATLGCLGLAGIRLAAAPAARPAGGPVEPALAPVPRAALPARHFGPAAGAARRRQILASGVRSGA